MDFAIKNVRSAAGQVFLSLGTNLDDRQKNLQGAVDALGDVMAVDAISPIYETEPWGLTDQPFFFNICLAGKTALDPQSFLSACKSVEKRLGRQPGSKWGPRLIDIDIIFYGEQIIQDGRLNVPHPHFGERAFVLVPLADIAPELRDPVSGKPILEQLAAIDTSDVRRLSGPKLRILKPAKFAWGTKSYVMGIINATPDSFSGDGLVREGEWVTAAIEQAKVFESAGVDIVDIGGESTRPGSSPVSEDVELKRVLPVISGVRAAVNVPISIDTYRARVAKAALDAGADWINDVWGLRMDSTMARLVAHSGCPIVVMHNRSKPKNVEQEINLGSRYVGIVYDDLIVDIKQELLKSVQLALDQGVRNEQIIIDPGIGFGKTVEQNFRLLNELNLFTELGYPILVGPSRKSFIGYTMNLPPEERVEGTAAAVSIAIARGADIVRVHDVKSIVRVAQMTDLIVR